MKASENESGGYDRFTEKKGLNHAVRTMPGWKKMLLGLSLLVGVAGFAVEEAGSVVKKTAPAVPTAPTHVAPGEPTAGSPVVGSGFVPAGSSGFVASPSSASAPQPAPGPGVAPADSSQTEAQGMSALMTPYLTRVGFSVFIGVVIGFLFRTFIKIAVGISALVVAAALALSYFHIVNIDMTAVKTETASASAWISDQAFRLKDVIFHALPSSTGAGVGFIFGFKRR
jgi:uncharacterized membrane protein (Fun14 family)